MKYFGYKFLRFGAIFTVVATVLAFSWFVAFPTTRAVNTDENLVYTIFSLTNTARTAAGDDTLTISDQLSVAANAKAEDILKKDYFSHTSPDGRKPWDFIADTGYSYIYAGENLAINYNDAASVQQAWMNSESHKENILNPKFKEIGIAAATGEYQGRRTTVIVEMFGTPVIP